MIATNDGVEAEKLGAAVLWVTGARLEGSVWSMPDGRQVPASETGRYGSELPLIKEAEDAVVLGARYHECYFDGHAWYAVVDFQHRISSGGCASEEEARAMRVVRYAKAKAERDARETAPKSDYKCLRVWPHWSGSGIWRLDEPDQAAAGHSLNYDQLDLPADLAREFKAWHESCAKGALSDAGGEAVDWDGLAGKQKELAEKLKTHLGPDTHVECRAGDNTVTA